MASREGPRKSDLELSSAQKVAESTRFVTLGADPHWLVTEVQPSKKYIVLFRRRSSAVDTHHMALVRFVVDPEPEPGADLTGLGWLSEEVGRFQYLDDTGDTGTGVIAFTTPARVRSLAIGFQRWRGKGTYEIGKCVHVGLVDRDLGARGTRADEGSGEIVWLDGEGSCLDVSHLEEGDYLVKLMVPNVGTRPGSFSVSLEDIADAGESPRSADGDARSLRQSAVEVAHDPVLGEATCEVWIPPARKKRYLRLASRDGNEVVAIGRDVSVQRTSDTPLVRVARHASDVARGAFIPLTSTPVWRAIEVEPNTECLVQVKLQVEPEDEYRAGVVVFGGFGPDVGPAEELGTYSRTLGTYQYLGTPGEDGTTTLRLRSPSHTRRLDLGFRSWAAGARVSIGDVVLAAPVARTIPRSGQLASTSRVQDLVWVDERGASIRTPRTPGVAYTLAVATPPGRDPATAPRLEFNGIPSDLLDAGGYLVSPLRGRKSLIPLSPDPDSGTATCSFRLPPSESEVSIRISVPRGAPAALVSRTHTLRRIGATPPLALMQAASEERALESGIVPFRLVSIPETPCIETRPRFKTALGFVGGEGLRNNLRPECEVVDVSEAWTEEDLAEVDLLIVETSSESLSGALPASESEDGWLSSLLDHCERNDKPTVLWCTRDETDIELFRDLIPSFDTVLVPNEHFRDSLTASCRCNRLVVVGPAVQPVYHNPRVTLSLAALRRTPRFKVLYDGWADVLECPGIRRLLLRLCDLGVQIVESRWKFRHTTLAYTPELSFRFLGHMTAQQLLSCNKLYKIRVFCERRLSSPAVTFREMYEAAACGALVIYRTDRGLPSTLEGVALEAKTDDAAHELVERYLEDEAARRALTHVASREVQKKAAYGEILARDLGLAGEGRESATGARRYEPLASVITITKRPESLSRCYEGYKRQEYDPKEWIVVVNRRDSDPEQIRETFANDPSVRVLTIGEDTNIGGALNLAIRQMRGEYWFKMDDDDVYGPNYVTDGMLCFRTGDYDLIGKPPGFMRFEGDDRLWERTHFGADENRLVLPSDERPPPISGATLMGRRGLGRTMEFPSDWRGSVDTVYLRQCQEMGLRMCTIDRYNFIAVRYDDLERHTWRIQKQDLIAMGRRTDLDASGRDVLL